MPAWKTWITSTMQTFDETNNSKNIKKLIQINESAF